MVAFFSVINLLNLICGIFSFSASFLIIKKDPDRWINRLLFATFFFWSLNIMFYSFVYLTTLGIDIINLFRDLNVAFGITAGFCLFLAGRTLMHGPEIALNRKNVLLVAAIDLIMITISLHSDHVVINPIGDSMILTNEIGGLSIFLIPGLAALFGVFLFYQVYREIEDPVMKKRVVFFMIGSLLLVTGAILFGIRSLIFPEQEILWVLILATSSWALGPLTVVWGFYGVKTSEQATD